jgi:hypothetical protein
MFILEVEAYFIKLPKYVIIFHRPGKSFHSKRGKFQNNFSSTWDSGFSDILGPLTPLVHANKKQLLNTCDLAESGAKLSVWEYEEMT